MTSRRIELREQAQLALPLALGQLGQQLMGLVDTAMLGRFDEAALAGAGIANSLLFGVTVFGIGVVMGMDTLVPQALGAGEQARARRLLWHGLRVAVMIGLPLTAIAALTPLLLPLFAVEPEISLEASVYVYGRLPAIIPFLAFIALRSYLQARNITRPIVIAMVAGNVFNVIADGFLIYGDRALHAISLPGIGMPALGSLGAALCTSIISVLAVAIAALAVRAAAVEGASRHPYDPKVTRSIIRLGTPIGLQITAEVGIFALTAILAGRLGTTPAAAHQVAITLASLTFAVALGIGAASSVLVGRAVGAGDVPGTRRAGVTGVLFALAFMAPSALVFLLFPEFLARLFTDDAQVIEASVPLLRIAAVFQLSDGAQAVATGALRGAGDTRSPLLANLVGHYAIALPLAVALAFGLDMGVDGLWWALCAGLTLVAIALNARFLWLSAKPIARAR